MKITSVTDAGGVTTATIENTYTANKTSDFASELGSKLQTSASLEKIFEAAAEKYGVDIDLLKAIAKAESNFNPKATSKSGAMGIMQLMPATAKGLGVKDAYDPQQNIMGGAKYIASLLEKYDGNISYALAAYNAGSGNVAKYGGIPPFEETQKYVAKVLGYLQDGGVTIPEEWSTVVSSGGVSAAGSSSEDTETTLSDVLKSLFTREDYEDFLRLFLERLLTRLDEKAAGSSADEDTAEDEGDEETSTTKAAAEKTKNNSDAYVAYRNFKNTNRIAIYLRPENSSK